MRRNPWDIIDISDDQTVRGISLEDEEKEKGVGIYWSGSRSLLITPVLLCCLGSCHYRSALVLSPLCFFCLLLFISIYYVDSVGYGRRW